MFRGAVAGVLCLFYATPALAVPPVPTLGAPFDGGWAQRQADLTAVLPPTTPADVTAVEFEVSDPSGTVVHDGFEPRDGTGNQQHTTSALPDAGFFSWRVRGVDDAGVLSAWSPSAWFQVDDTLPSATAFLTVQLDAGFVTLNSGLITDTLSGLREYHFLVSQLDQMDGGVSPPGYLGLTPTVPTATTRVGPGTWWFGVHGHDQVINVGPTLIVGPYVVPASVTVPPPGVAVIRFDGGVPPFLPYLPITRVRLRMDAGTFAPTGFVVIRQARGATAWELAANSTVSTFSFDLPAGDQDVRVSMEAMGEVSDWSGPVRVFVDDQAPRTPFVTATRDGGFVELRWNSTRDDSPTSSGVSEYKVSRCCSADASVLQLPNVPNVPDASITTGDLMPYPSDWSYSVSAVDRAGNEGSAARVTVRYPPLRPTGLHAVRLITNQPVQLLWDPAGDGGYPLVWDVTRVDAMTDAGVLVGPGVSMASFDDASPEGFWNYEVLARVGTVSSEPARLAGVIVDQTPPDVSVPVVQRTGARAGLISWTASDALSGLASVVLERESDGVVAPTGATTSPYADAPPDGTHRYRVLASDLAGNLSTSAWSPAFVTPGTGVQINRPGALAGQCGAGLEVTLTASEAVTWSLVSGPEGAGLDATSGVLTWTPRAGDVGTVEFVVSAQAPTSSDSITVPVEVSCSRRQLALGCGCDSGASSLVLFAVLVLRRRKRVNPPRPSPPLGEGARRRN